MDGLWQFLGSKQRFLEGKVGLRDGWALFVSKLSQQNMD